jgi:hypothetical protein
MNRALERSRHPCHAEDDVARFFSSGIHWKSRQQDYWRANSDTLEPHISTQILGRLVNAIKNHSITDRALSGHHQALQNRLNVSHAVPSGFRHTLSLIWVLHLLRARRMLWRRKCREPRELGRDVIGRYRNLLSESNFSGSCVGNLNI